MIKGKGEMTTYWLIGTAPAPKRGEPDGDDSGLKMNFNLGIKGIIPTLS